MVMRTCVGLGIVLCASTAAAIGPHVAGRTVIVRGSVGVVRAAGESVDLVAGTPLYQGDTIEVGDEGLARLLMADETVLDLGAGTRVKLREYDVSRAGQRRQASIRVFIGRLWARVSKALGPGSSFSIGSENAVAGVRGTELIFDVHADGAVDVTVLEGSVAFTSTLTEVTTMLGAMARASLNAAGELTRSTATAADAAAMRQGGPRPAFDDADSASRLSTARERLGIEVAPAPAPEVIPAEEVPPEIDRDEKAPLEDRFEDLDDVQSNPGEPLLDFEPDAGRARVRGKAEVVEP